MVELISILKDSKTKVAFHPKPKGVIQFVGGFVFGSFPVCSYKYLFQHLYEQGYSLIVYPFPFDPFQFNHWSVAIEILEDLYKIRVEIIRRLKCEGVTEQLDFYANDANYFWLGHSLGCKYILLLEILSNDNSDRRNIKLRSCLRKEYLQETNEGIRRADKARKIAIQKIAELLGQPCQLSPFIKDQPSLLLAPEINTTVEIFNTSIRPSDRLGFPNRHEIQCLVRASTELFNLMGLISFNLDGIARDDVDFLDDELQVRKFLPFLHKVFFGGHFEPQGIRVEHLVSCIDLLLQELRQRQRQGTAQSVRCECELSCGREIVMNSENTYDMIVLGSGNGACGFLSKYLSKYLEQCKPMPKILVLESGKEFFSTSNITHQNNWTKSYAEENIFQLHNAQTSDDIPIISGWANTMGGGGSINYAMIHESSSWLSTQFGYTEEYWDALKQDLNNRLDCLDPTDRQTQLTKYILQSAEEEGFNPQDPNNHIENIPSYRDLSNGNSQQLYLFSTQFNSFGQRTHSGVSLIDGLCKDIDLRTQCQVTRLKFDETQTGDFRCKGVQVRCLDTGATNYFFLNKNGRIILCAGAATPRLLMPHSKDLNNDEIGNNASDHIAIPLGIYRLKKKDILGKELHVTPRDNYAPIFATTVWKPEQENDPGYPTVCTFEFFSGNFERLWFFISHIYLAFLLPNCIKKIMIRKPRLFKCFKTIRLLVEKLNAIFNLGEEIELITTIVKFNPAREGRYLNKNDRITLGFFETDKTSFNQDKIVAEKMIRQHLCLMNRLGDKPHWSIRLILKYLGIPFDESKVNKYLDRYSRNYLLSQQHMAGGCLFGKAICKGLNNPHNTGKVIGSTNVHVADLSASPLPRVSPQMTAYLIGFHVAEQLSGSQS